MSLPKIIYYVELLPGGKPLGFREKGGGVYLQEQYARQHMARLEARGSCARLMVLVPGQEWEVAE